VNAVSQSIDQFSQLARAHGAPPVSAALKSANEDFVVEEIMPIIPDGEGEHLWLYVEKSGTNTDWLAQQLARLAGVKAMAVSYAGLKDRHGVTRQWFSIQLPGMPDPDLSALEEEGVRVLEQKRHSRKLKRGALSGNRFRLRLRDLQGDRDQLEARLQLLADRGVPNYFGEQRFGHGMSNIQKAELMFQGKMRHLKKNQRSLYLSAARSWIFNQLLSQRIEAQCWDNAISGDVFMLDGKSACFADDASEDINQRLAALDIHITGPLWGEGESMAKDDCLRMEQAVAAEYPRLAQGLEAARLKQERRSLRLKVDELSWSFEGNDLLLAFALPAGAYATMVIRELMDVSP
jgi:tRNA pseudouridine13 synthase